MFKTLREKITLTGFAVLIMGVALLVFTFASSYGFLVQGLSIVTSGDLARVFGEALGPLISACIHLMYLGVMVWIGSLLTIRGVTILSQARPAQAAPVKEPMTVKEKLAETKEEQKPAAKAEEKPKDETKKPEPEPYEPEIVVLTPETVPQTQQDQQQAPRQNQTENK